MRSMSSSASFLKDGERVGQLPSRSYSAGTIAGPILLEIRRLLWAHHQCCYSCQAVSRLSYRAYTAALPATKSRIDFVRCRVCFRRASHGTTLSNRKTDSAFSRTRSSEREPQQQLGGCALQHGQLGPSPYKSQAVAAFALPLGLCQKLTDRLRYVSLDPVSDA